MPPPRRDSSQFDIRGLRVQGLRVGSSSDQVDSLAYAMHAARHGEADIERAVRGLQEMGLDMRPGTMGRTIAEAALRESEAILTRAEESALALTPGAGALLQGGNFANLNADDLPSQEALRAMFEHLDRQALRPDRPAFYPQPEPSPPQEPPPLGRTWTMHELRGETVVNTRALQALRVTVPEFEIASNPTVQLGDLRSRRFDLIDRTYDHPIILALLAYKLKKAVELEWKGEDPYQGRALAKGPRRTAWERLLED